MQEERLMLIPDPELLEQAILEHSYHGKKNLLEQIATTSEELKAHRTRYEKLFPNQPIGLNVAISQLDYALGKTGFCR